MPLEFPLFNDVFRWSAGLYLCFSALFCINGQPLPIRMIWLFSVWCTVHFKCPLKVLWKKGWGEKPVYLWWKACVFRLPQPSFPTKLPSALWYILVGSPCIRTLSSVCSWDLCMNTFCAEQNASSGREDVSNKWENKRNGWWSIMQTL